VSERDKTSDKPGTATVPDEKPDEPFLKRWSRRKRGEEETEAVAGGGDEAVPAETATGEAPAIDPADLPDVESLNKDSDYSVFMQEGVPDALRTMALRKLFASNPALAVLDGLNDYDEDYSALGIVAQTVKTAYKAGRGFIEDEDLVEIDEEDETEEIEEIEAVEAVEAVEDGEAGDAPGEIAEGHEPAAGADPDDKAKS
jgi:hypothetical protein